MNTVVTSPSLALLEAELVDLVGRVKSKDALAPLTVLVGSNIQHVHLRRRLARAYGAVANVRFLTFVDLAGELLLARDDAALRPLPDGSESLLVRAVARGTEAERELNLDVTGMADAIGATIRELREGGIAADAVAGVDPSPKREALAAIYRATQERRVRFIDHTRLLEEAAALPAEAVSLVFGGAPVLIYGIYDVNALQAAIIAHLSSSSDTTAFVPCAEGSSALRFAEPFVRRLVTGGFAHSPIDGPAAPRPETIIFSASDRQAQAEEIARLVLADVESGVPVSEIAVMHRLDQRYDEVLAGVFDRASVPCYLAAGRPVRRTAFGRAALSLIAVLCDEPRRGSLLELLSMPCTRLDWVEAGLRPRPAAWEALSKEIGLVRGWDECQALLSLKLASLGDDTRDEDTRPTAQSFLDVVTALRARADRIADASTWSSAADRFVEVFESLVGPATADAATTAIVDRVRQLALLDEFGLPFDLGRFGETADAAIRQVTLSGGYFQRDGLFLGSVVAARGARFRRVYVIECAERVFPPVIREDPLLLDGERAGINAASKDGRLPLKRDRLHEERLLFELACQSAEERLVLSYSRRSNLSGTPRLPSSLLLQEVERISGAFRSIEELEREPPSWFRRMPSRIAFHSADSDDALRALDDSDLRAHVLEQAGPAANRKIRWSWPGYDRLYALACERRTASFGRFDGVVAPDLIARVGTLDRQQSPTSLAAYAICPYRYFLGTVLGLRSLDEPEQTMELAPMVRGELVHRVLERLVRRYLADGGDWAAFLAGRAALVEELLEEEFAQLPAGKAGLRVVRAITQETVASEIAVYLDKQAAAANDGWRPVAAEQDFDGIEIAAGDAALRFRGRIDRVDRREGEVRVVDYKTGGVWEKADGYRTGGSLQLPIYLLAAAQQAGVPTEAVTAAYHYVSKRAAFKELPLAGATLAGSDRFRAMLGAMREGIAAGSFFYMPDGGANCKRCNFVAVCDRRVPELFDRKAPGSRATMEPFTRVREGRS